MSEFAALIAIDWADQKHAVCLYDQTTREREQSFVLHTPAAFEQWANGLIEQTSGMNVRR